MATRLVFTTRVLDLRQGGYAGGVVRVQLGWSGFHSNFHLDNARQQVHSTKLSLRTTRGESRPNQAG